MFLFLPNIIVIPNQSISHTFFFSSCIYRSLLFDSSEYTYFRFASYSAPRKLKNFVVQSGVFFAINFPILNIYKVNIGEYIDMERGILCSDTWKNIVFLCVHNMCLLTIRCVSMAMKNHTEHSHWVSILDWSLCVYSCAWEESKRAIFVFLRESVCLL